MVSFQKFERKDIKLKEHFKYLWRFEIGTYFQKILWNYMYSKIQLNNANILNSMYFCIPIYLSLHGKKFHHRKRSSDVACSILSGKNHFSTAHTHTESDWTAWLIGRAGRRQAASMSGKQQQLKLLGQAAFQHTLSLKKVGPLLLYSNCILVVTPFGLKCTLLETLRCSQTCNYLFAKINDGLR